MIDFSRSGRPVKELSIPTPSIFNAKEKLVLESKAVLKGDIVTKILVVEAGAMFEGRSAMGNQPSYKPTTPKAE
jgi:cytoskeletal protein CcmA (bactofilin family)